jgi:hypothetical protein
MTLLQKLTATLNRDIMISCFRVPEDYDFNLMINTQKGLVVKKDIRNESCGKIRVHQLVIDEIYRLIKRDIPDIFAYINSTTGTYHPIQAQLVNSPQKSHDVFQVVDADVNKQEKLKQIRDTNKGQRVNLTKKNVADNVWKYRYIPPGLETNLLEKNTGADDVIKFRPLTRVDPYKRKEFNQRSPEDYILPSYVLPYSKKN